jgi:hypothetical protein
LEGLFSLLLKKTDSWCTVKKSLAIFPFPAGLSLTKLSLAGNNLSIPGQGEFG